MAGRNNPHYSQSAGADFESSIEAQARYIPGLTLVRQYPESKFVGNGKFVLTGNAWPDYIGFNRGLSLMFDAKLTGESKGFSPPSTRKHQFERMQAASENGVFCFYLLYWTNFQMAEIHRVFGDMSWPIRLKPGEGLFSSGDGQWLETLLRRVNGLFRVNIEENYSAQAESLKL